MENRSRCFVDDGAIVVPVKIFDLPRVGPNDLSRSTTPSVLGFSTETDLGGFLASEMNNDYAFRFISICRRNSYQALEATEGMMRGLVAHHNLHPSFWDICARFPATNLNVGDTINVPLTCYAEGTCIDTSYTITYPEVRSGKAEWTTRRSGLYHQFDSATGQSIVVLFSPTPNSRASRAIESRLIDAVDNQKHHGDQFPLWPHEVLLSAYVPLWTQYLASLEEVFVPGADKVSATFIDEELRIDYENMKAMTSLSHRFLQAHTMLSQTEDLLASLCDPSEKYHSVHWPGRAQLQDCRAKARSSSRTAMYLHQRARNTSQFVTDTISARNQIVAGEQNKNMMRLSKSAVFLTMVTLLYLPPSFLASFFSMGFFTTNGQSDPIIGLPDIWIYIVSCAVLITITFAVYYWLKEHDTGLLRTLTPRIDITGDWNLMQLLRLITSKPANRAQMDRTLPV